MCNILGHIGLHIGPPRGLSDWATSWAKVMPSLWAILVLLIRPHPGLARSWANIMGVILGPFLFLHVRPLRGLLF